MCCLAASRLPHRNMKKSFAILPNEQPSSSTQAAVSNELEETLRNLEKLLQQPKVYTSRLPRDVLTHLRTFCYPPLVTGPHHVIVTKGETLEHFKKEVAKKLRIEYSESLSVYDATGGIVADPFAVTNNTTLYLARRPREEFFMNRATGPATKRVKLVFVGPAACGKTALINAFVKQVFVKEYDPTVEDSFRQIMDVDGTTVFFEILDTAGQEEYQAMLDSYFRASEQVFVFCFSIASRKSFDDVSVMFAKYANNLSEHSCVSLLVGCQADRESQRQVSRAEAIALAGPQSHYIECSAKDMPHVRDLFAECVRAYAPLWHVPSHRNIRRCKRNPTCSLLGGAPSEGNGLAGGFRSHPLDDPTRVTARLGVDLPRASKAYLEFVVEVDRNESLADINVLERAVARYDKFMRLKAKNPTETLIPALDMQVVWYAHLIRPAMYERYCIEIAGRVIDHNPTEHSHERDNKRTCELYEAEYKEVLRDRKWLHLPGGLISIFKSGNDETYSRLAKEYEQFLYLHAKYPLWDLPASSSVDAVWHAHMLQPVVYRSDTDRLVGYRFLHDPWPDANNDEYEDECAFKQLDEMWQQEYGVRSPHTWSH